jgi:hypothetical protein
LVSSFSVFPNLSGPDVRKAGRSKSGFERGGIEGYIRVIDVSFSDPLSVEGVGGHESAAWSQHSVQFPEQPILRCGCGIRTHVAKTFYRNPPHELAELPSTTTSASSNGPLGRDPRDRAHRCDNCWIRMTPARSREHSRASRARLPPHTASDVDSLLEDQA